MSIVKTLINLTLMLTGKLSLLSIALVFIHAMARITENK
jgi:hypothetical protein